MGAAQGVALHHVDDGVELRQELHAFASWELADVQDLYKRFQTIQSLSISAKQLEVLLALTPQSQVPVQDIFSLLDEDTDGRIDSLEFIAALICVSKATFEDKMQFAFDVFDFNHNAALSSTELALLMKSMWSGMRKFSSLEESLDENNVGGSRPEDILLTQNWLHLSRSAFERYDRDASSTLSYDEFMDWARSHRVFMLQIERFKRVSLKAAASTSSAVVVNAKAEEEEYDLEMELRYCDQLSTGEQRKNKIRVEGEQQTAANFWNSPNVSVVKPPSANLELEWIYGAPSYHGRGLCSYLDNGNVVYVVSKYAIVYDPQTHSQRSYQRHLNPIGSLAVSLSLNVVATADLNDDNGPAIVHVWKAGTLECLAQLGTSCLSGVAAVALPSIDTKLRERGRPSYIDDADTIRRDDWRVEDCTIAVADRNGCIYLWNWATGEYFTTVDVLTALHRKVVSMALAGNGQELVICRKHWIEFYVLEEKRLVYKPALLIDQYRGNPPTCTSALYTGDHQAVLGTVTGQLLFFHYYQHVKTVQAHEAGSAVNACSLSYTSSILLTASTGGCIKQWDLNGDTLGKSLIVANFVDDRVSSLFQNESFCLSSVAYNVARRSFLVGTRSGFVVELYENDLNEHRDRNDCHVIAGSHSGHAIRCLATSQRSTTFATASASESSVYLWSLRKRTCERIGRYPKQATSLVFSSCGSYLIVGFKDGSLKVLNGRTLDCLQTIVSSESSVNALKLSLDNCVLAASCSNGCIVLFQFDKVQRKFNRCGLVDGTETGSRNRKNIAECVDLSPDGGMLRCQYSNGLVKMWNVQQECIQVITPSERNIGAWDSISVDKGEMAFSNPSIRVVSAVKKDLECVVSSTGELLIQHISYDEPDGNLALIDSIPMNKAHPFAHVPCSGSNVAQLGCMAGGFALQDNIFLSTVGVDGTICQWKVKRNLPTNDRFDLSAALKDSMEALEILGLKDIYFCNDELDECYPAGFRFSSKDNMRDKSMDLDKSGSDIVLSAEPPLLDLCAGLVFGMNYGCCFSGNGITVSTSDRSILYSAGSMIIESDIYESRQTRVFPSGLHYTVTCIVKHPTKPLLALGSRDVSTIIVWNTEENTQTSVLCGRERSTLIIATFLPQHSSAKSFSYLLATVWYDHLTGAHFLSIFDSEANQTPVLTIMMTRLPVVAIASTGTAKSAIEYQFVTTGIGHVTFWMYNAALNQLQDEEASLPVKPDLWQFTCMAIAGGKVVAGTVNGDIIVWRDPHTPIIYSCPTELLVNVVDADKRGKIAVVSIIYDISRSQVAVMHRSGHITLWSHENLRTNADQALELLGVIDLQEAIQNCSSASTEAIEMSQHSNSRYMRLSTRCGYHLGDGGLLLLLDSGMLFRIEGRVLEDPSAAKTMNPALDVCVPILKGITTRKDTMSARPGSDEVALASDIRIEIWDVRSQTILRQSLQSAAATSMTWNVEGTELAISTLDGNISVYNGSSLECKTTFPCGHSDSAALPKWCHSMTYSRRLESGVERLALGCRDYRIYVYESQSDIETYSLTHVFDAHTAPIKALDFSFDSTWLQSASNRQSSQVMQWKVSNHEGDTDSVACTLREENWRTLSTATMACSVSANVYDVSAFDRIKSDVDDVKWQSCLPTMAFGTEDGVVLLLTHPSNSSHGQSSVKDYPGYFSKKMDVSFVQFSPSNRLVLTSGTDTNNTSIAIIWTTDYEQEMKQITHLEGEGRQDVVSLDGSDLHDESEVDYSEWKQEDIGDEFLAVKPWLGAIYEPSKVDKTAFSTLQPSSDLLLDHVYGRNLAVSASYGASSSEIVYAAGAIGVIYRTKSRQQRFNQVHRSNYVSAMAVHPSHDIVVSSECGIKGAPVVAAWDAKDGSVRCTVKSPHRRGISLLRFNGQGTTLASLGMEDDHAVTLYAVQNGAHKDVCIRMISTMKSSRQRVFDLCFGDEDTFVTCGTKHILFWEHAVQANKLGHGSRRVVKAISLSAKKGLLSSHKLCNPNTTLLAVLVFSKQCTISAQSNGSFYRWSSRKCTDVQVQAHDGAIHALAYHPSDSARFISAGDDGKIKIWKLSFELLRTIDMNAVTEKPTRDITHHKRIPVRGVQVSGNKYLVSTADGKIFEVADKEGILSSWGSSSKNMKVHVDGHYQGELWGFAMHPTREKFASAGDEGTIRLWDLRSRSLLSLREQKSAKSLPRALAFSCDGLHLAVGCSDGSITILLESLNRVVTSWKCSHRAVQVIQYSGDGRILAVGAHDCKVHLYSTHSYTRLGEAVGHSGTVMHLDFAKHSSSIFQSTCTASELLFWELQAAGGSKKLVVKQIKHPSRLRDVKWESWTCPFGWSVQGIWPKETDGSDINDLCRSSEGTSLVTGNDDKVVRLFRYPCVLKGADAKMYVGHASHITNCRYSLRDQYVVTTSGRDRVICQYRFVYK